MNERRVLDPDQLRVVACDRNAVISAGAGSGKTTVLAERFVRLVRERKAEVDGILTLTFTRKASAEMYERIHALLVADSGDPLIAEQLARFDRAQISTLDSFCAQIARGWSQRFGVAPSFAIAEQDGRDRSDALALQFVLDNHDDPALAAFIRANGFEQVVSGFFASIAHSYFTIAEELDLGAMAERQLAALGDVLVRELRLLLDELAAIGSLDAGAAKAIQSSHERIARLPDLAALAAALEYTELHEALDSFDLDKRTGRASSEDVVRFKELVDSVRARKASLLAAVGTLELSSELRGMFALLARYQQQLLDHKRQSGLLSFHDVVSMAVRTLAENLPLRRFYKAKYRFIMIDEFQDNNELQKQLLYLLAERSDHESPGIPPVEEVDPSKLFFVGDEKQSIYRFRGADVSVFRGLSAELESTGGTSLSLRRNYRSTPELVEFFNRVFPIVMGDAVESYEARYEALESPAAGGASPGGDREGASVTSSVRVFYGPAAGGEEDGERADEDVGAPNGERASADDAEALHVVRFILRSVAEGSLSVVEQGVVRPVRFDDFALIMRSTGNQIRFERLLRRFDIPYATQSVRTLFLEAPLNDLYNMLQVVIHPDDRLAYAAALRSPFVNLSDDWVVRTLLGGAPPFAQVAMLEQMPEPERRKLEHGAVLYQELCARADLAPITELARFLWYDAGYRQLLLAHPAYHGYLEYYDYFARMAGAADANGESLAAFLDSIRPNLGKYERLPETTIVQDGARGVQLLTIHGAKGLEFPVVILANSGNSGRGPTEAPYYLSGEHGITLRLTKRGNYFYDLGKEENEKKETAEAKRLLYVALTRARAHLVISGSHNSRNRRDEAVHLNMVLGALRRVEQEFSVPIEPIEPVGEEELYVIPSWGDRPARAAGPDRELLAQAYERAAPIAWELGRTDWSATALNRAACELASVQETAAAASELRAAEEKAPAAPVPAARLDVDELLEREQLGEPFGTLCHLALERALKAPPHAAPSAAPPDPSSIEALSSALPGSLRDRFERLSAAERERLLGAALELARGFLGSELGREAARAAGRECECAFLYRAESSGRGFTIAGSLDLLFERGPDAIVVDYKSDREIVAGAYDVQMMIYRRAAAELTGRRARTFLYYLRGGEVVEVSSEPSLGELLARAFAWKPARPEEVAGTEEAASAEGDPTRY